MLKSARVAKPGRAQEPEEAHLMSTVKIHPPWYSLPSLFVILVIAGAIAMGPFAGWASLWFAAVFAVLLAIGILGAVVEVTPEALLFRIWPLKGTSVPRDQIRTMHLFGQSVRFEDRDHVLLKISTYSWIQRQWLDISVALGVPLYDHRTKLGWGQDARRGRLVQQSEVQDS
jgi:hypothetical protein